MDLWANPHPSRFSPTDTFTSVPTSKFEEHDHYNWDADQDYFQSIEDNHLSPNVQHRVNDEEWMLPEANYYLNDLKNDEFDHSPYYSSGCPYYYDDIETLCEFGGNILSASPCDMEELQLKDHSCEQEYPSLNEFMNEMIHHDYESVSQFENCNESQIELLQDNKETSANMLNSHPKKVQETIQPENTESSSFYETHFDGYSSPLRSCDRWNKKDKLQIISIANELAKKGKVSTADVARRFSEKNSKRNFDSAFKLASKLVKQGIISNVETHELKIGAKDDINPLTQLMKNDQHQTNARIVRNVLRRNKGELGNFAAF